MVRPTIMISSHGSPIILVSGDITFIPKFKGDHPETSVMWVNLEPLPLAYDLRNKRPRMCQNTVFQKNTKLDGHGRARREAARRRKSEWKVNVAIPNSSRSNGIWQVTPKTVSFSIVEPRGIWTCVSLQCTSTSGGSVCAL